MMSGSDRSVASSATNYTCPPALSVHRRVLLDWGSMGGPELKNRPSEMIPERLKLLLDCNHKAGDSGEV